MAAIMKEMDKQGVSPTKAMMELLFEHTPQENKRQKSISTKKQNIPLRDDAFFQSAFETIELQKENTLLKQDLARLQNQFLETLDKVQLVKSSFAKTKLQLNMDLKELQILKSSINKTIE